MRALLRLYAGHYRQLTAAVLIYVIKASPYWALPIAAADVVGVASSRDPAQTASLWRDGIVLLVLLMQNIPMNWLYLRLVSAAVRRVEAETRAAVAGQIQRLSMGVFTRTSSGALQSKLLRDAEVVEQVSKQLLMDVPAVLLTLLVALVVTATRAPAFLFVLLPAVGLGLMCAQLSNRVLGRVQQQHRQSLESTAGAFSSMLQMLPVTRAHGVEQTELSRLRQRLDEHRLVGHRLDETTGWFAAIAWVGLQSFGAVCLIAAGWAALHGRFGVSIGDIVLITGYFGTMTGAVLSLLNQLPVLQRGLESVRSIEELLNEPDVEDNDGKPVMTLVRGAIQLEDVSFCYDSGPAIDRLDLSIRPGEVIAVVGRSGAGKSTLLNLMLGFLRPTSGRILIDGVDLRDVDLRTYRRQIATVPQDVVLAEGSLRENLLHGLRDVTEEQLWEAVVAAGLTELVDGLPAGLDSRVGEQGLRLSGGQRQRVAIARALVRNPRILFLDEATSALDGPSEALVQVGLQRLAGRCTCLVVAHRLATIERADRILVLSHGRAAALGEHAELLESSEDYRALVGAAQMGSAA